MLHLHFTMDDNPSLSEDVRERYKTTYSGVFYKRFILGLWVMAQGAIYKDAWSDDLYFDKTNWNIFTIIRDCTAGIYLSTMAPSIRCAS